MITSLNYNNIPNELKCLKQWVCCHDTTTKLPLNPYNLKPASVDNPNTWGTYLDALAANTKHVGFVFTSNDPYCVIDLDDKPDNPATPEQREIFKKIISAFDSYTEISQSGFGVHVICKGPVFSGCRQNKVELYSKERYMIFTGNLLGPSKPIQDRSELIATLHKELFNSRPLAPLLWLAPDLPDESVLNMANAARNESGAKFKALWNGTHGMESHSEADFALLSLLCFYSKSDEQVIRLFHQSALGKREKAFRQDYLINSLEKIRASFAKPEVDLSQLDTNIKKAQKEAEIVSKGIDWPPGLVGEIGKYIFATSKHPVKEISMTASLALITSIVARAYNISHTGLNQYFILIAGTGRGKEEGRKGINRIVNACREQLLMLDTVSIVDDFIGPSGFESGQGLVRAIVKKPCCLAMLGEFGDTLAEITSNHANPNVKRISKVLRDVYNQSGANDTFRGSVYADEAKDVKDVKSPNLTIYAEGATETFFDSIEPSQIANGLIPRFLVLEYNGKRVASRKVSNLEVPTMIVERVKELFINSYAIMRNENVCNVSMTNEAEKLLGLTGEFDVECTSNINENNSQGGAELWNRAHLKAMKLAAMLAVAENLSYPVITKEQAEWSINLIRLTTQNLVSKFDSGEIGQGDTKQDSDFKKAFLAYLKMSPKERQKNGVGNELSYHKDIVPYSRLKNYLRRLSSFNCDRRGATNALDSVIARFIKDQIIVQIPVDQAFTQYGTKSVVYSIGPEWTAYK
jgi:hypothetical protein